MSGENYSYVREKLGLEQWDVEAEKMTSRKPTNAEILRLLDALHADIEGVEGAELREALHQRYWSS